jgi:hypothetical protein
VGTVKIGGWTNINDAQDPNWVDVNDTQNPSWVNIDKAA